MADKTLTFDILANDRASKTFDNVGRAAQESGHKLDTAAEATGNLGSTSSQVAGGVGDLGGALGALGKKYNVGALSKFGAGMETTAPLIMGVTGAADLAEIAIGKFPAVAGIAGKAARGLGMAFRFMTGPVGLIILAIAAAAAGLIYAYKHSETFRNIVNKVFAALKVGLSVVADFGGKLKTWIVDGFGKVVDIVTGLPGKIGALGGKFLNAGKNLIGQFVNGLKGAGKLVSDIAGNIWNAVKGLLNNGIDAVNNALEFTINLPFGKSITINPPDIPHLATGGIVTRPTLAVIGDNPGGREAVIPLSGPNAHGLGGGNVYITVNGALDPVAVGRQVQQALLTLKRTNGNKALGLG